MGDLNHKNIDSLHMKFLKRLLGVKKNKVQIKFAVLGEFGRLPLSVICKQRSLKIWTKIMSRNIPVLYETYYILGTARVSDVYINDFPYIFHGSIVYAYQYRSANWLNGI